MHMRPLTELSLYKYKYRIAYISLAILTVILFFLHVQTLPPGLTANEEISAVQSSRINLSFHIDTPQHFVDDVLHFLRTTDALNLPYHLLQKASLQVFGVTPLGVRTPSMVIGLLTVLCLFILLHRWLKPNAAIAVSLLVATSSWLIATGREGSPDIMIIFWLVSVLLYGTLIVQNAAQGHLWKGLALLSVVFSLYTPYMLYVYVAIAFATLTQPHVRFVIRSIGKVGLAISILFFLLLLAPLGFTIWRTQTLLWQLLAIPQYLPEPIAFFHNLIESAIKLISPFQPAEASILYPLLPGALGILTIVGIIRLVRDWHSVRSHLLLVWMALLAPVICLDNANNLTVLFIPVFICAGIGLQVVIGYWYRMFPYNPYARLVGLIPLGLLIFSLVQFGYERYFIAVPYAKSSLALYDQDAFILSNALHSKAYKDQRIVVIVPASKTELYSMNTATIENLTIQTPTEFTGIAPTNRTIVAEDALPLLSAAQTATFPSGKVELLVNDHSDNALRFRVYSTP
jgi:4-amino-4-deoxy-L-arabinose transferase-like glycosyltransferase